MNKVSTLILAAGCGKRADLGYNKMFYELNKPILCHTIDVFEKNKEVDEILIVVNKDEMDLVRRLTHEYSYKKNWDNYSRGRFEARILL